MPFTWLKYFASDNIQFIEIQMGSIHALISGALFLGIFLGIQILTMQSPPLLMAQGIRALLCSALSSNAWKSQKVQKTFFFLLFTVKSGGQTA